MQNSKKEDMLPSLAFRGIRIDVCEEKRIEKLESNCGRGIALFVVSITIDTRYACMSDRVAADMQILDVKMDADPETRKWTAGMKVDNSDRE
jgi:hypothetical protein